MYYLIRTEDGLSGTIVAVAGRTLRIADKARAGARRGYFGRVGTLMVEGVSRGYDGAAMPGTGIAVRRSGGVGIWLTHPGSGR